MNHIPSPPVNSGITIYKIDGDKIIYEINNYETIVINKDSRPIRDPYPGEKKPIDMIPPILVDENLTIIDGNHRYYTLQKLKLPIRFTFTSNKRPSTWY